MRLERLHIKSAPGLPAGLPVLELPPALTIIVGPNASGKSTISRTLRALLWPDEVSLAASAESLWVLGEVRHEARLFGGAVSWQPPLESGAPRGSAALARFGIASLLEADDPNDRDVAHELAQELAGGFDLEAAALVFGTTPRFRPSRKQAGTLKDAQQKLVKTKRGSDALIRLEGRLCELESEIDAASGARDTVEAARLLIEVLEAKANAAALEAALAGYPDSLEGLTGREGEELASLEPELVSLRAELAEAASSCESLAGRKRELEGDHAMPTGTELDTWAARIEKLRELERAADEQRQRHSASAAALQAAKARLHGDAGKPAPIDGAHLEGLAEAIREWRAAEANALAAKRTAEVWDGLAALPRDMDADSAVDTEGALRALRLWLRSADAPPAANARNLRPLAAGLFVLGALGAILALTETVNFPGSAGFALLALTGVALFFLSPTAQESAPESGAREEAANAIKRAGLTPPDWTPGALEAQLTDLERQREAQLLAERAATQATTLSGDLLHAEEAETALRAKLAARATAAGITEAWLDLGAAAQVEALVALGRAIDEEASSAARLAQVETETRALLDQAAAWLVPLGQDAPGDTPQLSAAHKALQANQRELANLELRVQQAEDTTLRLRRQADELATKREKLWQRTGLEDGQLGALEALMQELARWQEARQELRDATAELGSRRTRFQSAGGPGKLAKLCPEGEDLEALPCETVEGWAATAAKLAAHLNDLVGERGGHRKSLEDARRGHILSDAIAGVRQAAEDVAAERDHAATDAIGRALIEGAEREHHADHTPRLLQQAQAYFSRFTEGAWQIELGRDREFKALDVAAGQTRTLDELSDGTRVQLLLAARLAALEFREDSVHVPICLDEALSTTDPRRFRAAAKALFELAADPDAPRQILYFTSDHGEAEQWILAARELGAEAPAVIDLGRLTGEPADWGGDLASAPQVAAELPSPADHTPDSYATVLGVPAPDGFLEPATWHLFTLAFDHLDTLRVCLERRIASLGVWRRARDVGELPAQLDTDTVERLSARLELAEVLARLWRFGRGRPITWDDIEASGAVTKIFTDRVRAVLELHDRKPHEFITATRAIKRFKGQADKLEAHLVDCGALPTEEPLEAGELVRRTLAGAPSAAEQLGVPQATAFIEWLEHLLAGEIDVLKA